MSIKDLSDVTLAVELASRGYIVRHINEADRILTYHSTEPLPNGMDFQTLAVEEIRKQICAELITFERRPASPNAPLGITATHSATLRLL